MSTTEGLWSGKLFKIKEDEEEKIIGREKKIENGRDGQNKNKRGVVVKIIIAIIMKRIITTTKYWCKMGWRKNPPVKKWILGMER